MDVMEAIETRRTVRRYTAEAVPEAVLERLLHAAWCAPSGRSWQPYQLIVVRDQETKAKLSAACRYEPWCPEGQDFIAQAPVVVACGSEEEAGGWCYHSGQLHMNWDDSGKRIRLPPSEPSGPDAQRGNCLLVDMAIALDHLSLAAAGEGLASCWVMALVEEDVKRVLGIPTHLRAPIAMALGYPAVAPYPRERKPLDELVRYERYA